MNSYYKDEFNIMTRTFTNIYLGQYNITSILIFYNYIWGKRYVFLKGEIHSNFIIINDGISIHIIYKAHHIRYK